MYTTKDPFFGLLLRGFSRRKRVEIRTKYIPDSVSKSACRSVLSPIFIHSANLVDEKSSGV
jgi:hypothetical protein